MSFKVKRERNDQGVDEKSQYKLHDMVYKKRFASKCDSKIKVVSTQNET
jgi:hypothetical protein